MADRELFNRTVVTSPDGTTRRIAIGQSGCISENMTLCGLKTHLGVPEITPTTILQKSVDIGVWNMDGTPSLGKSLGVARDKIRGVDVIIKSDSSEMFPLVYPHSNEEFSGWWKICNTPTSNACIVLSRKADYFFDSSGFNSTAMNRGYILVSYVC